MFWKKDKLYHQATTLGVFMEAIAVGFLHVLTSDKEEGEGEALAHALHVIGKSLHEIDSSIDGNEFHRRVGMMMASEQARTAKSKGEKMLYKAMEQRLKEAGK